MSIEQSQRTVDRLKVLSTIDLDNPQLRQRLDAITERTAHRLGQPISLVSMVLDTAQFFAGEHGTEDWLKDTQGTPIEWSFCATAVATGEPYVVPDATTDERQAHNPLVTVDRIRSYAGVPIVLDGAVLGTHCVLGFDTHTFTEAELVELRSSADEITDVLQTYRLPDN